MKKHRYRFGMDYFGKKTIWQVMTMGFEMQWLDDKGNVLWSSEGENK